MEHNDTYKTLNSDAPEVLYKEKNSKFYGYAFPINEEQEVKLKVDKLKKHHFNARHFCYAFQIGTETFQYRVNDDGEPNNSAGMPIYGQIQSFGLTNVLIVVIRYFGGVKLGVGGLISAYRQAAQMVLKEAEIIEKTILIAFEIRFPYKDLNRVMRVIKEKQFQIISQEMKEDCRIEIAIRKKNADLVVAAFQAIYELKIKRL